MLHCASSCPVQLVCSSVSNKPSHAPNVRACPAAAAAGAHQALSTVARRPLMLHADLIRQIRPDHCACQLPHTRF